SGGEHVPDGAGDRVLDGAEGLLMAAAGAQPSVLRGEIGILVVDGCERGLLQRPVKPLGALAGATGAASAGGQVVAWAHPGPGGEMLGGREANACDLVPKWHRARF